MLPVIIMSVEKKLGLLDVPTDLLVYLSQWLPFESLISLKKVSKFWNKLKLSVHRITVQIQGKVFRVLEKQKLDNVKNPK